MTPLRQRLIEDLHLRGLSERTQERDVRAVRPLADHDHPSPARSTEDARRDDFLSLTHVTHASRSASTRALCGITFCYEHTRTRDGTTLTFVRPPQEHTLPVIRSVEDGHPLRQRVRLPRSRACLRTLDACGLRLQAGTHLQVPESDRARMVSHVRWGTGATDREGPLPQQTLASRRTDWPPPPSGVALACARPSRDRHVDGRHA